MGLLPSFPVLEDLLHGGAVLFCVPRQLEDGFGAPQLLLYLPEFFHPRSGEEFLPLLQFLQHLGEVLPGYFFDFPFVIPPELFSVEAQIFVPPGPHGDVRLAVGYGGMNEQFMVHGDGRGTAHLGKEDVRYGRGLFWKGEDLLPAHRNGRAAGVCVGDGLDPPPVPLPLELRPLVEGVHHLAVEPLLPLPHGPFRRRHAHAVEGLGDGRRGKEEVDHADGRPGIVLHDHGLNDVPAGNP